jgi:ABC-2 type transport system permease protein/lipopolysaccharide transport system permease protein
MVSSDSPTTGIAATPAAPIERDIPGEPPKELVYKHKVSLRSAIKAFWRYRELVRTLAERDFRSRYKQAVLGAGWALIMPVIMMLVFTLFFKRVARINTGDVPYPLFSYVALVPWTFFSSSMNGGGLSLATNSGLLNKLWCPREVFPLASIAVALVDMVVASSVLIVLFIAYGFLPHATSVWVPVLFLIQLAFTTGLVFAVAGLLVYFRDLRQTLPLMLQLGLFATPVAYGIRSIPKQYRGLYSVVNPLAPVIDGYRQAVLYGKAPDLAYTALAAVTSVIVLVSGYMLLKRLEVRFADLA